MKKIAGEYANVFGIHEALRRLGFLADDIYLLIAKSQDLGGRRGMHVVLKAQGKEFTIMVCPVPGNKSDKKIAKEWAGTVCQIQQNQEHALKTWQRSEIGRDIEKFNQLALALQNNGFFLPAMTN